MVGQSPLQQTLVDPEAQRNQRSTGTKDLQGFRDTVYKLNRIKIDLNLYRERIWRWRESNLCYGAAPVDAT